MPPTLRIDDTLELTAFSLDDKSRLVTLLSDPEIAAQTLRIPYPYTEKDAEFWLCWCVESGDPAANDTWAIRDGDGLLLGAIGLMDHAPQATQAEVGFWLGEAHRGKGVLTRTLTRLVDYVESRLGIERLVAQCFVENARSQRLVERCGFRYEGYLRHRFRKHDRWVDARLYARVRGDSVSASAKPVRPDFIRHFREIQESDDSHYPGSAELLSIGSPFARLAGLERLGVHHEILPPGRRTSWPHAESREEEFVYVVEGTPDVWIDGELHRLGPGDGVTFKAGTGLSHTFLNNTRCDARLLVVGERRPHDNQVYYPLHPERREQVGASWWDDVPKRALGSHDGKPSSS